MRLDATGLRWSAGGHVIIDGIDVHTAAGSVLGVLGPNGSGKSTLLRALSRVLDPDDGEMSLDGRPYRQWGRREMAQVMASVEQNATTEQDVRVGDVIDMGRIPHRGHWSGVSPQDRGIVAEAAARTGVDTLMERRWRTLSGGEQQRAQIARAFAQEGRIMLLDEPTNHLDISHQLDILSTLRHSGLSLVIALHDLNLAASYCDEVLVLDHGRAVALGDPRELLTPDLIRDVYHVEVRVLRPVADEPPVFQFLRPSHPTSDR